jgi:hypothetical protein
MAEIMLRKKRDRRRPEEDCLAIAVLENHKKEGERKR